MNQVIKEPEVFWKESMPFWGALFFCFVLLGFIFYDALYQMEQVWSSSEEYGHGYMMPFITAFLIWQKSDQLEKIEFKGSWNGFLLIIFGLLLYYVGTLSAIYTIIQYGFVVVIFGIALSALGLRAFKLVFVPLLILLFMIPLPGFLLNNLSSQLQLISSQIGVEFIRWFGISVFLEGNVIDLGVFKLQVVEACSGLNYLFPLMALAFIAAYFFTGSIWKKALIFLSAIPITVVMNSFRIGAIGVMVEYWGIEMAEGFLHDFEGWAIFMSCIAILVGEMWLLSRIGKNKLPLRETFGLDFPAETPEDAIISYREVSKSFQATVVIVALVAMSVFALPEREEIIPDRKQFSEFPLLFNDWVGRAGVLDTTILDVLKLSDYVINDYRTNTGDSVNFYSAYYNSQKKGASIHSPRSCIPGGGWRITSLEEHHIENTIISDKPLVVNRLLIEKGENKQLVYYWFQQRGRIITNEYLMKWYLFWDAMTKSRTDGALMRLTTNLNAGQNIEIADERLQKFARQISTVIHEYVPE